MSINIVYNSYNNAEAMPEYWSRNDRSWLHGRESLMSQQLKTFSDLRIDITEVAFWFTIYGYEMNTAHF